MRRICLHLGQTGDIGRKMNYLRRRFQSRQLTLNFKGCSVFSYAITAKYFCLDQVKKSSVFLAIEFGKSPLFYYCGH